MLISSGRTTARRMPAMVLVDTNVISEARKGRHADPGVLDFWQEVARADQPLFLS